MQEMYANFNPWIDIAVVGVFMVLLLTIGYIGDRYEAKKKSKLRGATRC